MGRMYSRGKGISGSALPYKKSSPSWLKTTPQEVRDEVDAAQHQAIHTSKKSIERGDGMDGEGGWKDVRLTEPNDAAKPGGGTDLQAGQKRARTVPDRRGAA
eukprot:scaffold121_cov356-Pavlova_lutheri.AAC.25